MMDSALMGGGIDLEIPIAEIKAVRVLDRQVGAALMGLLTFEMGQFVRIRRTLGVLTTDGDNIFVVNRVRAWEQAISHAMAARSNSDQLTSP
jgi:hypothetical protein